MPFYVVCLMLFLGLVLCGFIPTTSAFDTELVNPQTTKQQFQVLFYHLEKCGGTTVEHLLGNKCQKIGNTRWRMKGGISFPSSMKQLNWMPINAYTREEKEYFAGKLAKHDCVSGHFLADLPQLYAEPAYEQAGGAPLFVTATMLREPQSRLVSLYYWWNGMGGRVVGRNFGQFIGEVASMKDFHHKDNYYVRVFCPQAMVKAPLTLTQEDCDCALENLHKVSLVTIMEKFTEGMHIIGKGTGLLDLDKSPTKRNSKKHKSTADTVKSCNADQLAVLHEMTKYDQQLYVLATELHQRLADAHPTDYAYIHSKAGMSYIHSPFLPREDVDIRAICWAAKKAEYMGTQC